MRREKRTKQKTGVRAAAAAAVLALTGAASAAPVQYEGSFADDDQHFVLEFSLGVFSRLSARTLSWAQGGFAPVLSLFGPGGLLQQAVGSSNTCQPGSGVPDPATGFCWDAVLDGNFALGSSPSDGFQQDGQPRYTGAWYLGDDSRSFVNVDGSQRNGRWALLFGSEPANAVPEPAGWALTGLALAAALAGTLRRRKAADRHA